jgi:hypothetical protein
MELENLFSMAGLLAITGWIILATIPIHPYQRHAHLTAGVILPLVLSAGYLTLIAMRNATASHTWSSSRAC